MPYFPGGSDSKASVYNAGDPGSIPGLGRSPGEGNGNPLQYSCRENSMDRGAWHDPGKNTAVGCHFLLQGIFPTQGSNQGLLHCRWILYYLSHKGSPKPGSEAPPPFTSEQPPRSYLVVPAPLPAHLFQLVLENGVSS